MASPDSSATGNVAPLATSFDRHLHAENRAPATRLTYAKAVNQFDAYLAARGGPRDVADLRGKHIEGFLESRQMLSRYGASAAEERARAAYARHSPGDRL